MKIPRLIGLFFIAGLDAGAQAITAGPQSQTVPAGGTATFNVTATGDALSYSWQKNGTVLAGATNATLTIANVQPDNVGLYTAIVTSGPTSIKASAILGLISSSKVLGTGSEVGPNIVHANGNVYDQVLLTGAAASITADANQIVRLSYVDVSNDIVQVEFSGAGTLTLALDAPSAPAPPENYHQPGVSYVKGHAGIVISGANETTNVSVFSVGSITAVNQSLFKSGVTYDGMADIAFLAVQSANGKFGGIRTANTSYFASAGLTGIHAPEVQFTGPVYLGEITAFASAQPVLIAGSAGDARITGGDLLQPNDEAVTISGVAQLNFVNGATSFGDLLPAQTNKALLVQNGSNITDQIAFSGPVFTSLVATQAAAIESGSHVAEFTFTRTGPLVDPFTVNYTISGSASNGIDYPTLAGSVTFPAFASSVIVPLQPFPDTAAEGNETTTLTIAPGSGYTIGSAGSATVSIADAGNRTFVFGPEVSLEDQEFFEDGVTAAEAVIQSSFGVTAPTFTAYVYGNVEALLKIYSQTFPAASPEEIERLAEHGAETRGLYLFHHTLNPAWRALDVSTRLQTLAHDVAHVAHNSLMGSNLGPVAAWLPEGFAVYVEYLAADAYGFASFKSNTEASRIFAQSVSSLQSIAWRPAITAAGRSGYELGFTALEYLVEKTPGGRSSLVEYWIAMGEGRSWQEAFHDVFGISLEAFYNEFEAWRSSVATPSIRGVVTNLAGAPVAGVSVNSCLFRAELDGVGGPCTGGGHVVTGTDGSFTVPVAGNGQYFLNFGLTPGASTPEQGFLGYYSAQSFTGITLVRSLVTVISVSGSDVTGINVRIP